ncbi:MAG: FCD domain-containing protein [Microbacteriaceae bacterium]
MSRPSLVSVVADDLLERIVAGEFAEGDAVPTEFELAERHGVSRMTVREAVKGLIAQNVVAVVRGRGTYVQPMREWTALEPVLRATGGADAAVQLIELRRMFEAEAAALAAGRRDDEHLAAMEADLERMRAAAASGDVAAFVEADIAFHDVILRASGNVFLPVLFESLRRFLRQTREQTSRNPVIQAHAIERHAAVLEALRTGDPAASRASMLEHMDQTEQDLRQYVLS